MEKSSCDTENLLSVSVGALVLAAVLAVVAAALFVVNHELIATAQDCVHLVG